MLAGLVARVGPITHARATRTAPSARSSAPSSTSSWQDGPHRQSTAGVRTTVGETLDARDAGRDTRPGTPAAGLSANKLASLRDLSAKVLDGTVVLTRTSRRSDEELIARLVTVRGIGRWTAEMYLMFQLRRLDVWPVDDLGVRQGYALAWQLDPAPTAKQLEPLGDRFRPYRSIVARYCWAAVPLLRPGSTEPALR